MQPIFALAPKYLLLIGEASNTQLIVFGLTHIGLELMVHAL
jgi:hypothetical protein